MTTDINVILTACLQNIKKRVEERMKQSGHWASGNTAKSLRVEVKVLGHGVLYGSDALPTLERGRKPGRVPKGFADIIYDWAKAKRINPKGGKSGEKGLRSFAGAVAHSIMKKGTKLYRDKRYDDIYDTVFDEEVVKLYVALNRVAMAKVDNVINNFDATQ